MNNCMWSLCHSSFSTSLEASGHSLSCHSVSAAPPAQLFLLSRIICDISSLWEALVPYHIVRAFLYCSPPARWKPGWQWCTCWISLCKRHWLSQTQSTSGHCRRGNRTGQEKSNTNVVFWLAEGRSWLRVAHTLSFSFLFVFAWSYYEELCWVIGVTLFVIK